MERTKRLRGRPPNDISHLPADMQDKIVRHRERSRVHYYGAAIDPLKVWSRIAHNAARARAIKNNVPFDLTANDLYGLAEATVVCPITSQPLSYVRGTDILLPNTATVDRIIPELGYVIGNVSIMSAHANTAKCRLSLAELARMGRWAERYLQSIR